MFYTIYLSINLRHFYPSGYKNEKYRAKLPLFFEICKYFMQLVLQHPLIVLQDTQTEEVVVLRLEASGLCLQVVVARLLVLI